MKFSKQKTKPHHFVALVYIGIAACAIALHLDKLSTNYADVVGSIPLSYVPIPIQGDQIYLGLAPYHDGATYTSLHTTTVGTTSIGTSVVVASTTGVCVNDNLTIAGAGAGCTYSGKITAVSGTTLTISPSTSTSVTTGSVVFIDGDIATTTTGTNGAGTTINVVSTASFQPGEGVFVAGAGAAGVDYVGTVGVGSTATALVLTTSTSTSVTAGALVQHDETATLQAAINALALIGGGTIVPTNAIHNLNGPLQDTSGANAVIVMPQVVYFGATNAQGANLPITIAGSTKTGISDLYTGALGTTITVRNTGTIFRTSRTAGNLIAGFGDTSLGGLSNFTNVNLTLKNLTLRSYDNPSITMLNGFRCAGLNVDSVSVDTGISGLPSQPTSTNGVAIIAPAVSNDGMIMFTSVHVLGYYSGLHISEHFYGNVINIYSCFHGIDVGDSGGEYASKIDNLYLSACPYGVVGDFALPINFTSCNFEHQSNPAWEIPVADVDDASNLLSGTLVWNMFPASNFPVISGGINCNIHGVNDDWKYATPIIPLDGVYWHTGLFLNLSLTTPAMSVVQNGQTVTISSPVTPSTSTWRNGAYGTLSGSFSGLSISAKINNGIVGNTNSYFGIGYGLSASSALFMRCTVGSPTKLQFMNQAGTIQNSGAATITYDPVAMNYVRVRETGGTTFGEYSADGVTWVTLGSVSDPFSLTADTVFVDTTLIGQSVWGGYNTFDQICATAPISAQPRYNAAADLTAQSGAVSSITTLTPAVAGSYEVGGYVTSTTDTTDILNFVVTYTDETSTARTATLSAQATTGGAGAASVSIGPTAGVYSVTPIRIKSNSGSAIIVKTTLATGGGSITYDVGADIRQVH